ncbi:MAG TPA: SNF2 helicase-associated domain-containing protein, partial [Longimicrobium sp.]|nr:SNF2 helicase-associated domain-containing protein [Longimicrobium sp.]
MIVVHACWRERRLYLWGETPYLRLAPAARGRRPAVPRPRPHPFAADLDALRDALSLLGNAGKRGDGSELSLRLPSGKRAPVPSPHLPLAEMGDATAEAELESPWAVRAMAFTADTALDVLLALPAEPPQGVVVADTLRGLAEVAKLALELVARGRVVPVLEQNGREWSARWRPVLTDEDDAGRLSTLRSALPAACGAAEKVPGRAEEEDVAALSLASLVDGCVRQALGGEKLAPPRRGRRTAGEEWLSALAARAPWQSGVPRATAALHEALSAWTRAPGPAVDGGLRTCFRLSAPGDVDEAAGGAGSRAAAAADEAPWRLDFLIQAADDPSLIVPAEEVWRTRGALKVLRRTLPDPQERLLADLGRALRLFPPLEPALRGARPAGCALDAEAAYHFLREGAPLLAQAGFGVRVPSWWKKPAARLGLTLNARPASRAADTGEAEGRFGLDALCAYEWQVSLGGEPLAPDEFRALAKLKVPLVRFRGEWVELKPDEVQAALRMFERGATGEMTAAELLRLAAGAGDAPGDLPLAGVAAEGWLKELLAADGELRVEPAPAPKGFTGTLRPYQERGLGWLVFHDRLGVGACLADDMGLGK